MNKKTIKYKDKVEVISGFYLGRSGIAIDVCGNLVYVRYGFCRHDWFSKDELKIVRGRLNKRNG